MNILIESPQIIVIVLIGLSAIKNTAHASSFTNASERIGAFIGVIIHPVMWFGLLYWGGFFTAP